MASARVAVLTIVRDDIFFLKRFVAYYGGLLGVENVFVISHGDEPAVRDVAGVCNVIPIPAIETNKFTMLKSRTMNHFKDGLRQWYDHVVICDVDEFIVVDPATGLNLKTWLDQAPRKTVYTAMGLEIVHMRSTEDAPVDDGIIGPRMHAQVNLHYAKPCIVSKAAKIARGGHYSEHHRLDMPEFLYMFHMKFCDFDVFADTLDRRAAFVAEQRKHGDGIVRSNPQWSRKGREDSALFAAFERRPRRDDFDLGEVREQMYRSWEPRVHDMWHFHRPDYDEIYRLPDRFAGVDRGSLC